MLQLEQDKSLENKSFYIKRFAWGIALMIIAACLMGAFGSGPLSKKTILKSNSSLTYYNILRYKKAQRFLFTAKNLKGDTLTIKISNSLLRKLDMTSMTPEPERQISSGDYTTYKIISEGAHSEFTIDFKPSNIGMVKGEISLNNSENYYLQGLILP